MYSFYVILNVTALLDNNTIKQVQKKTFGLEPALGPSGQGTTGLTVTKRLTAGETTVGLVVTDTNCVECLLVFDYESGTGVKPNQIRISDPSLASTAAPGTTTGSSGGSNGFNGLWLLLIIPAIILFIVLAVFAVRKYLQSRKAKDAEENGKKEDGDTPKKENSRDMSTTVADSIDVATNVSTTHELYARDEDMYVNPIDNHFGRQPGGSGDMSYASGIPLAPIGGAAGGALPRTSSWMIQSDDGIISRPESRASSPLDFNRHDQYFPGDNAQQLQTGGDPPVPPAEHFQHGEI